MPKKLTNEEYIEQLKEKGIWDRYRPLEEYQVADKPILHQCLKCNHEWKIKPSHIKSGRGCPRCAGNYRPTNAEYQQEALSFGYKAVEEYQGNNTPILHQCLKCKHEWKIRPGHIKNGYGCPRCARLYRTTNEVYIEQLKEKGLWDRYRPLEEYQAAHTPILHQCSNCNHEWKTQPSNIKRGKGCPACANTNRMEVLFQEKMNDLGIPCTPQKSYDTLVSPYGGTLRFDFLIEVYGEEVLIEIDGIQHFKPVEYWGGWSGFVKQRRKDHAKFKWCIKNGIQLIRVPNLVSDKESLLEQYVKTIKQIYMP